MCVTAKLIEAPYRKIGYALVENSRADTLIELSSDQLVAHGLVPNQRFQCKLTDKIQTTKHIPTHLSSATSLYSANVYNTFKVQLKTFVCGVLVIDSKVTFGVNSKGMRKYKFIPHDTSYPQYIVASKMKPNASAVYVRVELNTWSPPYRATANLVEIFGSVSDRNVFERVLQHAYGLSTKPIRIPEDETHEFASRMRMRIDTMKQHVKPIPVVVVDPSECVDADDAMSLDTTRVGVHITDLVSHYAHATQFDALLKNARHRIASVYGRAKTTHLLPESIGCDSASLLPNQDRLSLSIYFSKDKTVQIKRDLVHITHALSYEDAESHTLVQRICAFCQAHLGFEYDDQGPSKTKQLVEFLMVTANSTIAEYLVKHQQPQKIPLRITHPDGKGGALYVTHDRATRLGWSTQHKGLGKTAYTHFTSPIRRFADQLTHAALYDVCGVFDEEENKSVVVKTLDSIETDLFHCNVISKSIRQYEGIVVWFQDELWTLDDAQTDASMMCSVSGTVLEISGPYARMKVTSPDSLKNRIARVEWVPPRVYYKLDDDIKYTMYLPPMIHSLIDVEVHWNPLHGIKGLVYTIKN